jgi:hypothetical protein
MAGINYKEIVDDLKEYLETEATFTKNLTNDFTSNKYFKGLKSAYADALKTLEIYLEYAKHKGGR